MGALKAAASPAAAPLDTRNLCSVKGLRPSSVKPCPTAAPICTEGPSRPRVRPPQGFVEEVKYLRRTAADALLLPFLYCHAYREKTYDVERYEVYRILLQDVLEEKANREQFFSKIQKYLRLRRV